MPNDEHERLYFLGPGNYVQHSGQDGVPDWLVRYKAEHGGEPPPYMPLPEHETSFIMGYGENARRIKWPGRGKLPDTVMDYILSNGTLPPYQEQN